VFGLSKRQDSLDERGVVHGLSELVKVRKILVRVTVVISVYMYDTDEDIMSGIVFT